jgi:hypothetical protein
MGDIYMLDCDIQPEITLSAICNPTEYEMLT